MVHDDDYDEEYEDAVEEWTNLPDTPKLSDYDSHESYDKACIDSYNAWAKANGKPIREPRQSD